MMRNNPASTPNQWSSRGLTRPRPHLDGQRHLITRADREWSKYSNKYTNVEKPGYWRSATCEEISCPAYEKGFDLTFDLSYMQRPEQIRWQRWRCNWVRHESDRSFVEIWEGSTVTFRFSPEQRCFKRHRLPVYRDPVYQHFARPGVPGADMNYDQFADHFNETSYELGRRVRDG